MSAPGGSASSPASQVRKGLEGVIASATSVGDVDGAHCRLIYRGYSIDELVGKTSFEEVSHLLLEGALPTRAQLGAWTKQLDAARPLEPQALSCLQALPASADPMALLRTAVSVLGLYDPDAEDMALEAMKRKAVRSIAKTATIVAAIGRLRQRQQPIAPKTGLPHAANFLYMLLGQEPPAEHAQALDAYFVLLAEHGLNASTFTARTVTGTQSDYFSAITAAIGTLKGPLHGAANRKAMDMLLEIGRPEQVEPYVQKTLADHKRFMGFGHRVYKGEDPRAKHLKHLAKALGDAKHELKWYTISERLQQAVWQAKQLYINVDFYSASLLYYVGIPADCFTTMFACARSAGWSAHILEQYADNRLIRPLSQYVGPRDLKFVPLDQRRHSG